MTAEKNWVKSSPSQSHPPTCTNWTELTVNRRTVDIDNPPQYEHWCRNLVKSQFLLPLPQMVRGFVILCYVSAGIRRGSLWWQKHQWEEQSEFFLVSSQSKTIWTTFAAADREWFFTFFWFWLDKPTFPSIWAAESDSSPTKEKHRITQLYKRLQMEKIPEKPVHFCWS